MTASVAYRERIGIHMGGVAIGLGRARKCPTFRPLHGAALYDKAGGDE